jgi:hypothetical protein
MARKDRIQIVGHLRLGRNGIAKATSNNRSN